MASINYYNKLGEELNRRNLGLDEKYIVNIVFSNGGEGYPPSKMKSFVLNHPNYSSVKMFYFKNNTYYIFTRSRKSEVELIKVFKFMLKYGIGKEDNFKVEIVKIKER